MVTATPQQLTPPTGTPDTQSLASSKPAQYRQQTASPETSLALPRAPWSEIGPEFILRWGYPDGKFSPEHVEILGPTGTGKTRFERTILAERVAVRESAAIFVATKKVDKEILRLGWPITDDPQVVHNTPQVIFWPRTKLLGQQRDRYMAQKIENLLSYLWGEDAYVILVFDEIATVEGLSPDLRSLIRMYWREARSHGITIVAMKQRPQGIQRDMHSESSWIACFKPKDEDDAKRYAEVLGSRKQWLPVLMGLNRNRYEFILKYERTGEAVISWVDFNLPPPKNVERGHYHPVRTNLSERKVAR
jgi:nucleoside-triphosphatase THEP1